MPKLMPSNIVSEVRRVLNEEVGRAVPTNRPYLTAYQILEKMDEDMKKRLLRERGYPGKHAKRYSAAASIVEKALRLLKRDLDPVEILETSFIQFYCHGHTAIDAGNINVGLYRLKRR